MRIQQLVELRQGILHHFVVYLYNMDVSGFGKRLKQAFKGASAKEIAELLEVSQQAVYHYIGGRIPGAEMLQKIAQITGCNLHWLLTGHGEAFFTKNLEAPEDSSSSIKQTVASPKREATEREIPWDEIYVLFSGLEKFPESPKDLDSLKMELEVVYYEIQKRLKQADILKRKNESTSPKSTE